MDPVKPSIHDRRKPHQQFNFLLVIIGLLMVFQAQGAGRAALAGQHFVWVIPKDTKVPVRMETSVVSGSSKNGDDFSVTTTNDLTVDGVTYVPKGSVISGKIRLCEDGNRHKVPEAIFLQFETITTSAQQRVPVRASLVIRGGVLHVRRGASDIEITPKFIDFKPLEGLAISYSPPAERSKPIPVKQLTLFFPCQVSKVPTAVLLGKYKHPVDLRPGDEFKIQLIEDFRMPFEPTPN